MIRQPHDNTTLPFSANSIQNNTTIEAVHFDLGKQGIAYYDKDTANYRVSGKPGAGNKGGVHRNDGVDIYKDSLGGYYVGSIEDGEWLVYTIDVQQTGKYDLLFLLGGGKSAGSFSILVNDKIAMKATRVPPATRGHRWGTIKVKNIMLGKGANRLKILANTGGFDLNNFTFFKQ
jgi:hypothetical protein